MLAKTGDGSYQVPCLDSSTHCLGITTHVEFSVHAGNYFRSGMNFTLANADVATFAMVTPDTLQEIHITWTLNASADGTFTVLEDVTSFAGGAAVTPLGHNRNEIRPASTVCTSGMTGANLITPTGGTAILSAVLSTGKGNSVSRATGAPFIFKKNSNYLFRYTNGVNANIIQLACEWHDHTPKGI